MVVEINNISKLYGNIQALNNVSFGVPAGTTYGILGPNGSGKTTLLGILMDVLRPSGGSVQIFGHTPTAADRQRIGTLLETPNFYHYMSGAENLAISARIKRVENPDIDGVLKKVNLYQRRDSKFQTYSLGMKQRLAIAACLLGDPQVMVFDEPTNGLDPVGIAEIRDLIKRLASEGKTIVMASHLLDEVEKVCSHVAILKKGKLIAEGHVDEILLNDDLVEIGADNLASLRQSLQSFNGAIKIDETGNDRLLLHFAAGTANPAAINQFCFQQGIALNHIQIKKKSLESKFIELTNEPANT